MVLSAGDRVGEMQTRVPALMEPTFFRVCVKDAYKINKMCCVCYKVERATAYKARKSVKDCPGRTIKERARMEGNT